MYIPAPFLTDFYKTGHGPQYPALTEGKDLNDSGELRPIFKDSKLLIEENFNTIRNRLWPT